MKFGVEEVNFGIKSNWSASSITAGHPRFILLLFDRRPAGRTEKKPVGGVG